MADTPDTPEAEEPPPAAGLLPSPTTPVVTGSVFDGPLLAPSVERSLAYEGATPEQIADEIAKQHDLDTPNGWTEAMRALASRPEVLRRLVKQLTDEHSHPKLFNAALRYVTENGVGRPIERHEHHHSGVVGHVVIRPPIQWTDEPPPTSPAP